MEMSTTVALVAEVSTAVALVAVEVVEVAVVVVVAAVVAVRGRLAGPDAEPQTAEFGHRMGNENPQKIA